MISSSSPERVRARRRATRDAPNLQLILYTRNSRIRYTNPRRECQKIGVPRIACAQVKGTWIETGWTRCAEDGLAELSTLEGDQYRVELNSGVYRQAIVEVPGGGELVEVDVILEDLL